MTNTMTDIYLGRIVKAFGIRGELKFHPAADFWEAALQSKRLRLESPDDEVAARPVVFKKARPHGTSYVVSMDGIDDRNGAEALVGCEVFLADGEIDVDMPDHPLPYQLIGLSVKTEEGEVLGEVTSVVRSAAHDLLEVKGEHNEFLVPAIAEFVISIDLEEGALVVRPIPGLIEE
jgi:16S rRNA processing protein RimM